MVSKRSAVKTNESIQPVSHKGGTKHSPLWQLKPPPQYLANAVAILPLVSSYPVMHLFVTTLSLVRECYSTKHGKQPS